MPMTADPHNAATCAQAEVTPSEEEVLDAAMAKLANLAESAPESAPQPPITIRILSHHDCLDGIAAAWVVWDYYARRSTQAQPFDIRVDFLTYHQALPELPAGDHVVMVDFCPNDVTELFPVIANAASFTLLDHHPKTAAAIQLLAIEGLKLGIPSQRLNLLFDAEKSGALMAWEFFHSDPVPDILKHVSDRDLWHFKLPHTRAICEYLMLAAMSLETFDEVMWRSRGTSSDQQLTAWLEWIDKGELLLEAKSRAIEWAIQETRHVLKAHRRTASGELEEVFLLAINGSHPIASAGCERLEQRYPGFAGYVCHWVADGGAARRYSIRSTANVVNDIAKTYGGQGHEHAAGFTLPIEHCLSVQIESHPDCPPC